MAKSLDELAREIEQEFKQTQEQFDKAKLTIATAGILVALNLNTKWSNSSPNLYGHSAYKLALVLNLLSLLAVLLSFVPKEFSVKWMDKNINRNQNTTFQNLVLRIAFRGDYDRFSKYYPRMFIKYPDRVVSALNYIATLLLLMAIGSFLYLVIKT